MSNQPPRGDVRFGIGHIFQYKGKLFRYDDILGTELDQLDRRLYDGNTTDQCLLGFLLDSVRQKAEYGGNIAETMIQAAARNGELSE
jgi:hypothetical protein